MSEARHNVVVADEGLQDHVLRYYELWAQACAQDEWRNIHFKTRKGALVLNTCPQCFASCSPQARFCVQCGSQLTSIENTTIALPAARYVARAPFSARPICPGNLLAGRYRIERRLGAGGFGATFLASDTQLNNRHCVVKQLTIDPQWSPQECIDALTIFRREAELLIQLNHPGHGHIPEIYAYLEAEACLVMKYIEGESLDTVLMRCPNQRLEVKEGLAYIRDICSALVYMHNHPSGVVLHRDIKPSNIMLGIDRRVWLIDFGLARANPVQPRSAVAPGATVVAGTIGYTPPEQWQGNAQPRSDVYALAATLHTLLTGYIPQWDEADIQAIIDGRPGAFPPARHFNSDIPEEVDELIRKCMAFEPVKRPTAEEMLRELDSLLQPRLVIQSPSGVDLANERQMARWGEQHWGAMADWLYDRNLPAQIERLWGKNKLAQEIHNLRQRYLTQRDAGVDAVLALLDPDDFGRQVPMFHLDRNVLDYGCLGASTRRAAWLTVVNSGRRYGIVWLEKLPHWIIADTTRLELAPGASMPVRLTVDTSRLSSGGLSRAELELCSCGATQPVVVQVQVPGWKFILLRIHKWLAAPLFLSGPFVGFIVLQNIWIYIADTAAKQWSDVFLLAFMYSTLTTFFASVFLDRLFSFVRGAISSRSGCFSCLFVSFLFVFLFFFPFIFGLILDLLNNAKIIAFTPSDVTDTSAPESSLIVATYLLHLAYITVISSIVMAIVAILFRRMLRKIAAS